MLNLDREITPEDFAVDPNRIFVCEGLTDDGGRREYEQRRTELKRLYEIQEEAKAKARFKAEQARKDAIPFSEKLATEICERISAGEFLVNICKDEDMPTVRSVSRWRKEHADFEALHKEAVNDRLDIFEDSRNLKQEYEVAHGAWRVSYSAWGAQHRKIENDRSLDLPDREAQLAALGNAPIEPIKPLLTTPEPTVEALAKHWPVLPGALGLFSAEGGQMTGGARIRSRSSAQNCGHAFDAVGRIGHSPPAGRRWDNRPAGEAFGASLDGAAGCGDCLSF